VPPAGGVTSPAQQWGAAAAALAGHHGMMHRRGGRRTGTHAAAAHQTAQLRRVEVTEPRGAPQKRRPTVWRPALGMTPRRWLLRPRARVGDA